MGEKMQDILGTRGQIPTKTFLAAHDRGVALQCKHFMEVSFLLVFFFMESSDFLEIWVLIDYCVLDQLSC